MGLKLRILNYDYFNLLENEYDPETICPVFIVSGREEDGTWHCIKMAGNKGIFRPHFYVPDNPTNRTILDNYELEWAEWPHPTVYDENEKVLIAYTRFPFEVAKIRNVFQHTYEADVMYAKMFIMKLRLEGAYMEVPDGKEWVDPTEVKSIPEDKHFHVAPRIFYVDIESDILDNTQKFTIDNCNCISLVVYDNYLNQYDTLEWSKDTTEYYTIKKTVGRILKHPDIPDSSIEIRHHCVDEKQMLTKYFELFKRHPDALFTFNGHGSNELVSIKSKSVREWHNGFDEPVIFKRAKLHKLDKEMQQMSPLPDFKNKFGNYYGVYKRGRGDKFEIVVRGLTPLDFYYAEPLMQYTAKYRDFFGRSLDAYLKYFAKHGKVEHAGLSVAELKEIDLEKELFYNKVDVEGNLFLDKRFGFSDDIFDTVSLSKVQGIDILSATKIHDFMVLDESQDYCVYDTKYQRWDRNMWEGWLHEKKDEYGIIMQRHKPGGYNVEVKKGIWNQYMVMDFSSFYPELACAANAGIDTLIQVKKEFADHYIDRKGKKWMKKDCIITPTAPFRKDIVSIETQIWRKLLTFRQRYKKKYAEVMEKYDPNHPECKLWWSKQYNLKTRLINNKYGASGNRGFRNYCFPVYGTPPTMAQMCIQIIENWLLAFLGYSAYAGDTDSIMVALKAPTLREQMREGEWIARCANWVIDKFLKLVFNIDEHNVHLGVEKVGPWGYGHKKKNYVLDVWAEDGKILAENKRYILYKGFELKKGNRADITEIAQKSYFKVARKCATNTELLEQVTKLIERADELFFYIPLFKVCPRINIRKKLDDYKPTYFARRAAEYSNTRFKTTYGLGSYGFMAWLTKSRGKKLQRLMMFNKKDIKKILEMKTQVDFIKHKSRFMVAKFDLLLEDFSTSYHKLLRGSRIGSPNEL